MPVKIEAGKVTETVKLINWEQTRRRTTSPSPRKSRCAATSSGGPTSSSTSTASRSAVIELKNSHVSIGDGIRQLLSNQQPEFNEWFFTTVQIVFAGNDSEGLRYGTINTEEKYFLKWKEDEADNTRFKLDKYLLKMCRKERLIELMHDFVLFDGGVKKLPRVHQYFGVKAAQEHVTRLQGRHHLAHAGQRQKHRHGAAGQVDSGEQAQRPRGHHHRPRRTRQTDRARLHRQPAKPSTAPAAGTT